jgi:hypothetical protein
MYYEMKQKKETKKQMPIRYIVPLALSNIITLGILFLDNRKLVKLMNENDLLKNETNELKNKVKLMKYQLLTCENKIK